MMMKMNTTSRWLRENEAATQLRVDQYILSKRPERGARSQALALTKFNFSNKVSSLAKTQDILILHGSKDSVMPIKNAQLLLTKLKPAAQLYVFDQIGHCPYLMVPDLFVAIVVAFITRPTRPESKL
jgi:pimeloyl-ACP methyl ester carboxylesterase